MDFYQLSWNDFQVCQIPISQNSHFSSIPNFPRSLTQTLTFFESQLVQILTSLKFRLLNLNSQLIKSRLLQISTFLKSSFSNPISVKFRLLNLTCQNFDFLQIPNMTASNLNFPQIVYLLKWFTYPNDSLLHMVHLHRWFIPRLPKFLVKRPDFRFDGLFFDFFWFDGLEFWFFQSSRFSIWPPSFWIRQPSSPP